LDPFDEFARAIAADNPEKYTTPEPPKKEAKKEAPNKKGKKKSKKEEFEEYETAYLKNFTLEQEQELDRQLQSQINQLTREEVQKARADIDHADDMANLEEYDSNNEFYVDNVEVNRIKPRKVSDIHKLTREEVEKARAEIEIIKIKEPDRQSQKTIPTQETILNAGITLDNCYVILGVDQFITCDELKEQFRKLSVKYNSSIGMLNRTKEENEKIGKVHTRINQAYAELDKAHKCRG